MNLKNLGKCRFCKKNKAVTRESGEWEPICMPCLLATVRSNVEYFATLSEEDKKRVFENEWEARVDWQTIASQIDSASTLEEINQLIDLQRQKD